MARPSVLEAPAGADRPKVAPHAGRRLFVGYLVFGAFTALAGVYLAALLPGALTFATASLYVAFGGWFLSFGVYGATAGSAVQAVNTSLNLIGQGRLREAEALLDGVRSSRVRNVQRAALVQRALIAIRRGDLTKAAEAAGAAIQIPLGWLGRLHARPQRTNAYAVRALVRASAGDAEGARADIAEARSDADAPPQALARAALAEALLLEKAGDRGALGALIARERRLLLEATEPRERAIVRGLQRLLKTPPKSVYRVQAAAAQTPAGAEELTTLDWAQVIAPGVAPFVRAQGRSVERRADANGGSPRVEATEGARAAVKADRARAEQQASRAAAPRRRRVLAAVIAATVVVILAYQQLTSFTPGDAPDDAGGDPRRGVIQAATVLLFGLIGLAAARLALSVRRLTSETKQISRVATQVLRGDHEGAARALEGLAKSSSFFIVAQAELLRAGLAERRADFVEVIARCDAALGHLSQYARRVIAGDLLLPEIVATRAAALAALGRAGESVAEIASLPPAYPFLARARFRAELFALARAGDLAGAAEIAAGAPPDLPIGPRDELLRDVVRAAAAPEAAGSAELERLREEIAASAEDRAWLDAVAPGLLGAFERAITAEDHAAGEAEAEAEAEAAARAGAARLAME